jgi:hypothetical protein
MNEKTDALLKLLQIICLFLSVIFLALSTLGLWKIDYILLECLGVAFIIAYIYTTLLRLRIKINDR